VPLRAARRTADQGANREAVFAQRPHQVGAEKTARPGHENPPCANRRISTHRRISPLGYRLSAIGYPRIGYLLKYPKVCSG
jgi:hypothetical protein